MKNWPVALLLLTSALAGADAAKSSSVQAEGAYIAAVPATNENTAAYMILKNPTDHSITLLGGSSPAAKAVEIHKHVHKNGKMKMVHLDSLEIPAQGEVKLAPMGLHIMLIGLKDGFRNAATAEFTLNFSDQSTLKIKAPIKDQE